MVTADRIPGALPQGRRRRLLCLLALVAAPIVLAGTPVRVSLSVEPETVRVDEPFTVRMTLELPALGGRFADTLPLLPRDPPTLDSPVFDLQPPSGLEAPDMRAWLEAQIVEAGRQPGVAINQYTVRTDPFGGFFGMDPFRRDRRAVFGLPGKSRIAGDGRQGWRFEWQFAYRARREGNYPIGPVTFAGPVITAVDAAGNPQHRSVDATAEAVMLRVLPPPLAGRPESFVGVTGTDMRLQAELDRQISTLGEPLRLTLEITGDLSRENLTPPRLERQPALTERFRVQETVETTVLSEGKRFVYRLRPREAGTQELPPIEAAYYDLNAEAYRTVRSAPIPLQVRAATELEISIAGVRVEDLSDSQSLGVRDTARLPSAFLADSDAVMPQVAVESALWPWAFGPLGFALVFLCVPAVRGWRQGRGRGRRRQAVARTRRALGQARNATTTRTALDAYLTQVRHLPPGALTPGEVRRHLCRQGVAPDLADAWQGALERLDAARYRPEDDAPVAATPPDVTTLLALLEPTETGQGKTNATA